MDVHRIRTVRPLGALALTAVLVLGACAGEDGETTGPSPAPRETPSSTDTAPAALDTEVPDLCGLFTVEDFEAVTGEVAGPPERQEPIGAIRGSCATSATTGFPLVLIAAYDEADREETLALVDAEPVEGLGLDAFWDDTVGVVIPLEGKDWYLQVMATGGGADRDVSLDVARIALDRL